MPSVKEIFSGILGIIIASALLMLAVVQLDSSGWAEAVRTSVSTEAQISEGQAENEGEGIPESLMFLVEIVGSILRLIILIGIPGLITLGILRLIERNKKRSSAKSAAS